MTPEELLEAAERVRLIVTGERVLKILKDAGSTQRPLPGGFITCTCPPYGTCMNVNCPRAVRFS